MALPAQSKPKRVLPHERTPLTLLALLFVLFKTGLEITGNFAEVIYFRRVGVENLPKLYTVEPLAMVFVLAVFGLVANRLDNHKLLLILNLVFAGLLIAARFLIQAEWPGVYFALYISQRIFFALLPLTFWLVCSDYFDIRQAKRLFVLLTASGLVGTLLGNLLTGILSGMFTAEGILTLTSIFFAASLGVGFWLARLGSPKSFIPPKVSTAESFAPILPTDILKQPFIRIFILLILVTGMLEPVWRYELNAIANASFAAESSLIAFYGYFKGAAVLVVVLFQLFLAGKLMQKMGLPWAVSTHPLGLVGVMLLLGFYPLLWMAVASVALIGIVRVGFDESGRKAIVGIYPQHERTRVGAFERQMTYLGIFLGGLFMIWAVDHLTWMQVNAAAAALAATWMVVLPRFRARYAEACLRRGRSPLDDIHPPLPDGSRLERFVGGLPPAALPLTLRSPLRPVRQLAARSLLDGGHDAGSLIAAQLAFADQLSAWRGIPQVGKLAAEGRMAAAEACLLLLDEARPQRGIHIAARMLRSPAPDVRANGLEALDSSLKGAHKTRLLALFESVTAGRDESSAAAPPQDPAQTWAAMADSTDPEIAFWGQVWRLRGGDSAYSPPDAGVENIPAGMPALRAAVTYPQTGGEAMELADKIDALRRSETFAALSETELRVVASCAREAGYPPDAVVFEEGQPGSALYILLEGQVELASVAEKKSLQALGPGGVFGEHALFTEEPYSLTAVTISKTRLLVMERETFLELIQYYPSIALSLLRHLAKRFEAATALLQKVWV